ncbi:hypothetical protein EUGRSUZ_L01822 [Eucalyptus grandis]|uniref:Uncharacterized protein n=1 Tax=Eucalyptus grandis TaxID=71139 RepID=A0A058ZUC2_EUCGR|nr:hypothetical protein EUGRSUZ_L01822 [Eucalyptus grandis]
MVYHSSFLDEEGITRACGCPLLPLKSHIKGPAPTSEQAITFFRANVFFRNFDIKSVVDKLLIYLTFYINVAVVLRPTTLITYKNRPIECRMHGIGTSQRIESPSLERTN